jgi:hypothetical protein
MAKSTAVIGERPRRIAHRTYGRRHGPIARLMSPSDLGQSLKPFVFLDLFDTEGTSLSGFLPRMMAASHAVEICSG